MLWVLKELCQWDGSSEQSKHMFKLMGKEINAFLCAQNILIWTYAWVHIHTYENEGVVVIYHPDISLPN